MSTTTTAFPPSHAPATARPKSVSWTIWAGVLGVTSSTIGGAWDVAWHRSIGRDSFLTPAHIAIYMCGVVALFVCAYLIFYTTFGPNRGAAAQLKAESVHVLGFRAPLGAFIAAWGGIAMLTSAPFDNWWHAAYGLDVKIISPPHTLLILGIRGIAVGILFLIIAAMNRARGNPPLASQYKTLQALFLYMGGLMVMGQMFFLQENTWDVVLHRGIAYMALGAGIPVVFALVATVSENRWASTITAAIYMVWLIAEILIFPLVPASPKLGPVFFPVTHLVPAKFPVLLILPALALDLLWHRLRTWKPWQIAAVSGIVFVAVLFAVEWPFANFLMSKASENRFFGTMYFDYNSRPDGYDRLRLFFRPEHGLMLARHLLEATIFASISTWCGLKFGNWMRTVQR
jgi:hypothetical protein